MTGKSAIPVGGITAPDLAKHVKRVFVSAFDRDGTDHRGLGVATEVKAGHTSVGSWPLQKRRLSCEQRKGKRAARLPCEVRPHRRCRRRKSRSSAGRSGARTRAPFRGTCRPSSARDIMPAPRPGCIGPPSRQLPHRRPAPSPIGDGALGSRCPAISSKAAGCDVVQVIPDRRRPAFLHQRFCRSAAERHDRLRSIPGHRLLFAARPVDDAPHDLEHLRRAGLGLR